MKYPEEFEKYLKATDFIESTSEAVNEFVKKSLKNETSDIDKAVRLFYAVRDGIRYDPYRIDYNREGFKATTTLKNKYGFCIPKAILLASVARAVNIPSRLHFVDVINHFITKKLYERMKSNVFHFHAYTEMYLEGKWVKATPAFNSALCDVIGVLPLEFDGRHDSLFQELEKDGKRFMEYIKDRGVHADLPYNEMIRTFKEAYPDSDRFDNINITDNFYEDLKEGFK